MIVSITGHRPEKIGGYRVPNPTYNFIRRALDEAFLRLQPNTVIVGMAQGVDQLAAELCAINQIPFIAAIPFVGFESRWPAASQIWYRQLLGRATTVRVICSGDFAGWKMQTRNEWMVDHSDLLLAVWNGTNGGTANCVNYARRVGKRIERIEFPDPGQHIIGTLRTVGAQATPPVIRPAAEALRQVPVEVRVERPRVRISDGPSAGDLAARERSRAAMDEEERLNAQRVLAETRRAERQRREREQQEEEERAEARRRERQAQRDRLRELQREQQEKQEEKKDEPQIEIPRFGRILDLDV